MRIRIKNRDTKEEIIIYCTDFNRKRVKGFWPWHYDNAVLIKGPKYLFDLLLIKVENTNHYRFKTQEEQSVMIRLSIQRIA